MKKLDQWDFDKRHGKNRLRKFAEVFKEYQSRIPFKVSARGWCYLMEQGGFITKDRFDLVNELLNRCRKKGLLPVDFCAEDVSRQFHEVHSPSTGDYGEFISAYFSVIDNCGDYYSPDFWSAMSDDYERVGREKYYIQLVVEKVDLLTMFQPICRQYHVPIANARGWQSIRQRANYARRFQEARQRGMTPVLLYCGDFDPDGLRISDTLFKNLEDIKNIVWEDGTPGFDPDGMIIERFGLNYDFIIDNNLTWIDNLITGSGKNLASPNHRNFNLPYVQEYLQSYGARKCEANAIVVIPDKAEGVCREALTGYLGEDALERFAIRKRIVKRDIDNRKDRLELKDMEGEELLGWGEISEALKSQL